MRNLKLVPTTTKKNIHTGRPVISPYEEYLDTMKEREKSVVAEEIKERFERTKNQSDIYKDPKTGKTVVQSKGITPTFSPIDAAVMMAGAGIGAGMRGAMKIAELINPTPFDIESVSNSLIKYSKPLRSGSKRFLKEEAIKKEQDLWYEEGKEFNHQWFYDDNGKLNPEVVETIDNIYKRGEKTHPTELAYIPGWEDVYHQRDRFNKRYKEFIVDPVVENELDLLEPDLKNYILNANGIGGVRSGDVAVSLRRPKEYGMTWYGKPKIKRTELFNPSYVGRTAAHEGHHLMQDIGRISYTKNNTPDIHTRESWMEAFEEPDSRNLDRTKIPGRYMSRILKDEEWEGKIGEFNSVTQEGRFLLYKTLKEQYPDGKFPDGSEITVRNLRKILKGKHEEMPAEFFYDWILENYPRVKDHFKEGVTKEQMIKAMKYFVPALAAPVGIGKAIAGDEEFETGGDVLNYLQPTDKKLSVGQKIPLRDTSTELSMSIGGEGNELAYLIPTFKYGKSLENPIEEFLNSNDVLGGPFKTWQEAEEFAKLRHNYVEKGQDIPSPIRWWGKEFRDGGEVSYETGGFVPSNTGTVTQRIKDNGNSNFFTKTIGEMSLEDWEKVNASVSGIATIASMFPAATPIAVPIRIATGLIGAGIDSKQSYNSFNKGNNTEGTYDASTALLSLFGGAGAKYLTKTNADEFAALFGVGLDLSDITDFKNIILNPNQKFDSQNVGVVKDTIFPKFTYPIQQDNTRVQRSFATGGNVMNRNINVEGGEMIQTPSGELFEMFGPSHNRGGINTSVPVGSKVYSDKIKVGDHTMAERKEWRTKEYMKLLGDKSTDKISDNTKRRKMAFLKLLEDADMEIQNLAHASASRMFEYGGGVDGDWDRYKFKIPSTTTTVDQEIDSYAVNYKPDFDHEISTISKNIHRPNTYDNFIYTPPSVDDDKVYRDALSISSPNLIDPDAGSSFTPAYSPKTGGFTPGDMIGMAGTLIGGVAQIANTIRNRKANIPTINHWYGFNESALGANAEAMDVLDQNKSVAAREMERQIRTSGNTARRKARGSAMSIGSLRNLDLATELGIADTIASGRNQLESAFGEKELALTNNKIDLLSKADMMRRIAQDKIDEIRQQNIDNFYTNFGQNLADLTTGMQKVGAGMNNNLLNKRFMRFLPQLNRYGIGVDEDWNLIKTK